MFISNEDKVLVKVLRQDKGYNAKNWINFLTSCGRVLHWTDCCGRLTQRVPQTGCTAAAENVRHARTRTLTMLKSMF